MADSYWFAADNGNYVIGQGNTELAHTLTTDVLAEEFCRRVVAMLKLHAGEETIKIEWKLREYWDDKTS